MVRRIAAILLLGPDLDKRYEESKATAVEWKDGAPEALGQCRRKPAADPT
jgi:hypothetical protein